MFFFVLTLLSASRAIARHVSRPAVRKPVSRPAARRPTPKPSTRKPGKVYHYEGGKLVEGPIPTHIDVQIVKTNDIPDRKYTIISKYRPANASDLTNFLSNFIEPQRAQEISKKAMFSNSFRIKYNRFIASDVITFQRIYKRLFGCLTYIIKVTGHGTNVVVTPAYAGVEAYTGLYNSITGKLKSIDRSFVPLNAERLTKIYNVLAPEVARRIGPL